MNIKTKEEQYIWTSKQNRIFKLEEAVAATSTALLSDNIILNEPVF